MQSFFRSVVNAVNGVWQCVLIGRNLRIQIACGIYILLISPLILFTRLEYAVVFLTISLVISLEIINTSIERLCDQTSSFYTPLIRFVKDAAAGGVFVSAFFAVWVFIALFLRQDRIQIFLRFCADHIWYPVLLVALLIPAWLFIFWGPGYVLEKIKERKNKR